MTQGIFSTTNAEELKRLTRALRRAQGFALYFVRCNVPAYRNELVAELKQALNRPIVEAALDPQGDEYSPIEQAVEDAPDDAVIFIYGLERLMSFTERERANETLVKLNWRRSAYQRLERPLVFWIPEYVIRFLSENAPDFFDWNSGIYVFEPPREVRDSALASLISGSNEAVTFLDPHKRRERIAELRNIEDDFKVESEEDQRNLAELMSELGNMYFEQGGYSEAQRYAKQALNKYKELENQFEIHKSLSLLGEALRQLGDFEVAKEKFESSIAIGEEIYGSEHPIVASDLIKLGLAFLGLRDYEGMRKTSERAIEIYKKAYGIEDPRVAINLGYLGVALLGLGDHEGAKEKLDHVITTSKRFLGSEDPLLVALFGDLGLGFLVVGDYESARENFERAIAKYGRDGIEDPQVAINLGYLGVALLGLGDHEGARKNFEKSLEIRKKLLGDEHPDTIATKQSLESLKTELTS